jgi:hypothetical protein
MDRLCFTAKFCIESPRRYFNVNDKHRKNDPFLWIGSKPARPISGNALSRECHTFNLKSELNGRTIRLSMHEKKSEVGMHGRGEG